MASLVKNGSLYTLRYRNDQGQSRKKSLGKVSKRDAEQARDAATLQENSNGKVSSITIDISDASSGQKFNEFIEKYIEDFSLNHPRTGWDIANRFRADGPIRAQFGNLVIANGEAVADRWVRAWTEYQTVRVTQVAARTVQKEWQYLRAALNRAADDYRLVRVSPLASAKFDLDIPELEISYFEPAELELIYEADPANAATHRFLANNGIRRGEAIRLDRKDVGRDEMRVVPGKTNKGRTIPLSEGAQEARDRILRDHQGGDPFFSPVHKDTWTSRFHKARVRSGLDAGTFHWLRHTFISTLINDVRAPLPVVKELAGHANIETTMKYVHVKDKHFHEAINGLSNLRF